MIVFHLLLRLIRSALRGRIRFSLMAPRLYRRSAVEPDRPSLARVTPWRHFEGQPEVVDSSAGDATGLVLSSANQRLCMADANVLTVLTPLPFPPAAGLDLTCGHT